MLNFGPAIHFSSSRYESRHRDIKSNLIATASRRNPMKTIAIKQMCHLNNTSTNQTFQEKMMTPTHKINQKEIYYAVGDFILVDVQDDQLEFGEIIEIKKAPENIILVHMYYEISFDDHYHAYIIEKDNSIREIKTSDLPFTTNYLTHIIKNDCQMLVSRYRI